MWCLLDGDLKAFGTNAGLWTTAAQGEGEWRKTAEQRAERLIVNLIAPKKARVELRHTTACSSSISERDRKDQ